MSYSRKLGGVMARSRERLRNWNWNPPVEHLGGVQIPFPALNVWIQSGPRGVDFEPDDRILRPGADDADLPRKIIVPDHEAFKGGQQVKRIRILRRDRGNMTWRLRDTWGVGEEVTADGLKVRTQNAAFGPPAYRTTAPAGGSFTAAGDNQAITIEAIKDGYYEAKTITGTVKVVADIATHAASTAKDDMKAGRAWKPVAKVYQDELDNYNRENSPTKAKATAMMAKLAGLKNDPSATADDLVKYLDSQISDGRFTRETADQILWNISDRLQVRYKKNDDRRGPSFCIEGKTVNGFSWSQDTVAFKVMPGGDAAPKGPGDTWVPDWVQLAPDDVRDAYIDASCNETHISF
jgi:hypothetical protein